jgi:hypothetical protein
MVAEPAPVVTHGIDVLSISTPYIIQVPALGRMSSFLAPAAAIIAQDGSFFTDHKYKKLTPHLKNSLLS